MANHKRNEDITEELGTTNIKTIIKKHQKIWREHLEGMPQHRIPKLFHLYKMKGRRWQGCVTKMWNCSNLCNQSRLGDCLVMCDKNVEL
jgi:hypothetical protein